MGACWWRDDWLLLGHHRRGQVVDFLEVLKLFKQNEAALVTKANLREAMIVILSKIEHMFADPTGQLFNRAVIAIWDKRRDVHNTLIPFISITPVWRSKDKPLETRCPMPHWMGRHIPLVCFSSQRKFARLRDPPSMAAGLLAFQFA